MTDDDTQAMSIRLPRELHDWLRRESFETRAAMNTIIAGALSEYRAKQDPAAQDEKEGQR